MIEALVLFAIFAWWLFGRRERVASLEKRIDVISLLGVKLERMYRLYGRFYTGESVTKDELNECHSEVNVALEELRKVLA